MIQSCARCYKDSNCFAIYSGKGDLDDAGKKLIGVESSDEILEILNMFEVRCSTSNDIASI